MTDPQVAQTSFPIQFAGALSVRCAVPGRALTLEGLTATQPLGPLRLTFSGSAPRDLPAQLPAPRIEQVAAQQFRIISGTRVWDVAGVAHLHWDVGAAIDCVLPPRQAPLLKRVMWRVLLGLAGNPLMRSLLLRK